VCVCVCVSILACRHTAGRAPKRYTIRREKDAKARITDIERNTMRWEADAHTIMCANYWTPLADAMGEAIVRPYIMTTTLTSLHDSMETSRHLFSP
jgi:hypothetical protein